MRIAAVMGLALIMACTTHHTVASKDVGDGGDAAPNTGLDAAFDPASRKDSGLQVSDAGPGDAGFDDAANREGEDALAGCRAASEPGCESCCIEAASGCTVRRWTGGSSSDTTPWYNSIATLNRSCPSDCSACASCLWRHEEWFHQLGERPECDCETPIDSCDRADSCACYCARRNRYLELCPHLSDS